ncbi:NAD(P)H-dependent oxidoreductase [Nodosilinea sp. PGN35]|uniref:NAD(P)H-dependent oxidoreductase n=1 Tax=Nodosilinea sp. PGN35 TaxID=3020489 RepID=UPI0023B2BFDF|nr:NAD(P)H-dependent oxidoreductase [Nodosilinea sp. TSF1-S3]MDF0370246.1 NAD(P)H-dependent oxidoreductase [Nodosilinea sp. TSF1-S3]
MNHALTTPNELIQQLNWRYATKQFDPTRTIADSTWLALEQSLVLSPSSFGLQPWKFFVVRNPALRQQLKEHAWGQAQITDASHLVVLAIKKDIGAAEVDQFVARMAEVRQVSTSTLDGYGGMVKGFLAQPPYPITMDSWAARQVYIALGFLMYSAALLGVDTCPIEGFSPEKFNELLQLPEQGYSAVVLCAVGYRAEDDNYATLAKVRYAPEAVVGYYD